MWRGRKGRAEAAVAYEKREVKRRQIRTRVFDLLTKVQCANKETVQVLVRGVRAREITFSLSFVSLTYIRRKSLEHATLKCYVKLHSDTQRSNTGTQRITQGSSRTQRTTTEHKRSSRERSETTS